MDEQELLKIIEELGKKLPKFKDGRIDYSNSNIAPVITVFVKVGDEVLLLKRSNKVSTYKGKWNTVAGYLDELKPIREKVLEELKEEVGIEENIISSIHIGEPFKFTDKEINKTWLVCPSVVELLKKPEIKLNWEHTEFKWVKQDELSNYDTVPNLIRSFENACKR